MLDECGVCGGSGTPMALATAMATSWTTAVFVEEMDRRAPTCPVALTKRLATTTRMRQFSRLVMERELHVAFSQLMVAMNITDADGNVVASGDYAAAVEPLVCLLEITASMDLTHTEMVGTEVFLASLMPVQATSIP